MSSGLTYQAVGVDTAAGDRAVELMKASVAATHRGLVRGGGGGFAGLIDASRLLAYREPLLATSTDGVGTKVAIAQAMDIHDTVGIDLVGMVVDDLVACGATPLVMTDYIATGRVVPERIAAIVRGIALGCQETGTVLAGGETAEHPGLLGVDEYDVAGAAVGIVEADDVLGPERVRAGDVVVGMASSGFHSNGYSLLRAIVAREGWAWDRELPECGRSVGEVLLEPTALYTANCLGLMSALGEGVRAFAHVTGGGLADNLARVVPAGLDGVVRRSAWEVPASFVVFAGVGGVAWEAAEKAWNLGVGMVAVLAPECAEEGIAWLGRAGREAFVIGEVVERGRGGGGDVTQGTKAIEGGRVVMQGEYRV
ncbi:MAG: phosphoribosylformylglycinamidine cyclo-ligase [Micrococcales bacterium]|nr:phosphoribosylformylglycinamidine cyclo-ligase [Micrococcales bacterium]